MSSPWECPACHETDKVVLYPGTGVTAADVFWCDRCRVRWGGGVLAPPDFATLRGHLRDALGVVGRLTPPVAGTEACGTCGEPHVFSRRQLTQAVEAAEAKQRIAEETLLGAGTTADQLRERLAVAIRRAEASEARARAAESAAADAKKRAEEAERQTEAAQEARESETRRANAAERSAADAEHRAVELTEKLSPWIVRTEAAEARATMLRVQLAEADAKLQEAYSEAARDRGAARDEAVKLCEKLDAEILRVVTLTNEIADLRVQLAVANARAGIGCSAEVESAAASAYANGYARGARGAPFAGLAEDPVPVAPVGLSHVCGDCGFPRGGLVAGCACPGRGAE